MKSIIQQIADQNKVRENAQKEAIVAEIENPTTSNNRRNFLKKTALGGIAIGGLLGLSIEDTLSLIHI